MFRERTISDIRTDHRLHGHNLRHRKFTVPYVSIKILRVHRTSLRNFLQYCTMESPSCHADVPHFVRCRALGHGVCQLVLLLVRLTRHSHSQSSSVAILPTIQNAGRFQPTPNLPTTIKTSTTIPFFLYCQQPFPIYSTSPN